MEPATEEDAESMSDFNGALLDERDCSIISKEYATYYGMEIVDDNGMEAVYDDRMEDVTDDCMETVADDGMEDFTDDGMETVTDDGIRERFQLFFSIHPDLKPGM
jgi:hypothetical protein